MPTPKYELFLDKGCGVCSIDRLDKKKVPFKKVSHWYAAADVEKLQTAYNKAQAILSEIMSREDIHIPYKLVGRIDNWVEAHNKLP